MATFTLAALQSERTQDPALLGYAGKTDAQVASILNLASGAGSASVFKNNIPYATVLQSIPSADYLALTELQLDQLNGILLTQILDATNANTQQIFAGIFAGKPNTITAFQGIASRPGSRAEVLWGTGIVITEQQVGQARNGS